MRSYIGGHTLGGVVHCEVIHWRSYTGGVVHCEVIHWRSYTRGIVHWGESYIGRLYTWDMWNLHGGEGCHTQGICGTCMGGHKQGYVKPAWGVVIQGGYVKPAWGVMHWGYKEAAWWGGGPYTGLMS